MKDLLIRPSMPLTVRLTREQIVPIAVLFLISSFLNISLEFSLQTYSNSPDSWRWVLQLTMAAWELIEGILLFLILSWGIPKVRALTEAHFEKHPFEEGYLGNFLAEYFRVLANVLMWGILFVIPGFVRYCRLIFVPSVALFARPYREGKVDAFELAKNLSRGRMLLLMGLVLLTSVVQFAVEMLPQIWPELHVVPLLVLFNAFSYLISIWTYAFLYLHFEKAMEEHQWT